MNRSLASFRLAHSILLSLTLPALSTTIALPAAPDQSPAATKHAARFPADSRNWRRADEARLITDLSTVQPATALVTGPREPGKWKVIPYATESFSGNALSAYRLTEPARVQLPLDAKGWHAVYVGLCTVSEGLDRADKNGLLAKISNETVYRRMANCIPLLEPRRDVVQEIFLTAADLAGQSLDMAPMPFEPATVCYVKLVPLTADEVAAWQTPRADDGTRTSIATFDGHSWIWPYRPRTAEDLLGTFRGLERSDVGKWWFQVCGADLVCYPSKVGNIPGDGTRDFNRWEYREYTEALEALFAAGVNPLRVAREEARRQGAEFSVFIRPTGWKGSIPWEEIFNSRFFDAHPEWRCVDRDGTPTLHLSYAYPEVRRHVLDVLRETLEVEPDGVGYLFHRGMPMILWEEPFLAAFRARHNADAREVPEDDPRILSLRAELMTDFLRETRAMLDETAQLQGRRVPYKISLATFSLEPDNRKFGIDLERWIQAGLVNDVAVAYFAHHTSFGPIDMDYYRRITAGTDVGLYPFVIAWHSGKPRELCAKVTDFFQGGATGIAIWDIMMEHGYRDGSPGPVSDIGALLGHRALIADWAQHGPPLPHTIPLTRLGDNHYSRWFPNTGF